MSAPTRSAALSAVVHELARSRTADAVATDPASSWAAVEVAQSDREAALDRAEAALRLAGAA